MADLEKFRNLDKRFRFITNPEKTEHEVLGLQKFPWLALDDLDLQMVQFLEDSVWTATFNKLRT